MYNFQCCENKIDIVSQYKYLGVILDEFLSFDECASVLAQAGGRGLGAVISKFRSLNGCNYHTFYTLYNSCVVPIFSYGAGIWGYKKGWNAEKIHNRALRYLLGVSKNAANLFLQGDSGWLTPEYLFQLDMLKFWNRLCNMENHHICKQIFNLEFHSHKRNSWMYNI